MKQDNKYNPDKCQRCGEVGEDRRTIHMAAFYQLDELGIPFDQYQISGEACGKKGERECKPFGFKVPVFKKPTGKKSLQSDHKYFCIRVCKECRADWMKAVKDWYFEAHTKQASCGSGIFVRRNGVNVEITEDEWNRDNPDRVPYRVPNRVK